MSLLFADPDELRAVAARVSGHADAIRRTTDRLTAQIGGVRWSGAAAASFDAQIGGVLRSLHRAAGRLDDAADALRRMATVLADFLADVRRALADAGRTAIDVGALAGDLLTDPGALGGDLSALVGDAGDLGGDVLDVGGDVLDGALGLIGL